ncbi:hypothetical protein L7F22_032142 [Adiantum nelumboides]|nr:hypothetical protein [Adiantum nelumboides]
MSVGPMLMRIAYQALGMIDDLPAAGSQASLIQHASDDEKTKTNKEKDSDSSDKEEEESQKGADAKGSSEHEPSEEDTSMPLDKKGKKPRLVEQVLLDKAKARVEARKTILADARAAKEVAKNLAQKVAAEEARKARLEKAKALQEEKRRIEAEQKAQEEIETQEYEDDFGSRLYLELRALGLIHVCYSELTKRPRFVDVKSIVDFLKQDKCFEHVNQSCASLWATHESSSANEVESHAYDEVLSFDDVNLHEESCASSIMKEDSFTYMCGKESNVIACLDPCLDNCRDEGLSSSMCWSYMLEKDLCCDVEDMHATVLDDVFLPPSDALSRYPDELWVRGPVWDAEMDSDHVCGIVGGTKVSTGDSFDCNQNMACSQNEDYGTFVADDDDDGWGFDEPQIEDNLFMASYVQKAQERLRNLKIQKQAEKTEHVLEKAHSVDVLAQDFEPHAENKAKEHIMADMDTKVLMDACDGRGAMKAVWMQCSTR